MTASTGNGPAAPARGVLIIVENLPVPFDRRVWQEATALAAHGYRVSVICPTGRGHDARREIIDGVHIYRHPLPIEANGAAGYALEYLAAFLWQTFLAWRVFLTRGFDVIHACNPPDTIFLVAAPFKFLFGRRFVFDHHDVNPELYVAKFGRQDFFHRLLCRLERWTFRLADVSIATNESYREIAIRRGGMEPRNVVVVRSGPSLERLRIVDPDPALKRGRAYLVGYVGVIAKQEGISYLLDAVAHIVHDMGRTDVQFCLVGAGPELDKMRDYARQLGIDAYVDFKGFAPDAVLLSVLSTADVCVNPDEVNPMNDISTMNKIMEYMALGKPIVQFETKEGRFSAGEASLYAAPNDAIDFACRIVELLDDPDRRAAMSAFGRHRVQHELAWPHEVPKLLGAYDRLWPAPAPAPAAARIPQRTG